MINPQKIVHINTSAITTVIDSTVYLQAIVFNSVNGGTSWLLTIQDKAATPHKLIGAFVPAPPSSGSDVLIRDWTPPRPIRMEGGIDIVTSGATPGDVWVWLWYSMQPEPLP